MARKTGEEGPRTPPLGAARQSGWLLSCDWHFARPLHPLSRFPEPLYTTLRLNTDAGTVAAAAAAAAAGPVAAAAAGTAAVTEIYTGDSVGMRGTATGREARRASTYRGAERGPRREHVRRDRVSVDFSLTLALMLTLIYPPAREGLLEEFHENNARFALGRWSARNGLVYNDHDQLLSELP